MFTQDVTNIFLKAGLKQAEVEVYLCLLKSKEPLQVYEIAKETKIKRSTVNLILARLIDKGYVTYHLDNARKVYSAENPTKIAFELEDLTQNIKSIIPLLTLSKFGDKPSKVRFFEGEDVVANVYKDVVLTVSLLGDDKKEVSMVLSGDDLLATEPEAADWFAKKRMEEGIRINWIAPESKIVRKKYLVDAQQYKRKIKFFDGKKYPFHIYIIMYANCVALISLKGNRSGVIIENELLASSFQSMFNFFWDSLK